MVSFGQGESASPLNGYKSLTMEINWLTIFAALFIWWMVSVALAFRKGIFVEQLQRDLPMLFMIPRWMSIGALLLCMLIVAPYVMLEPFKVVRQIWRSWIQRRKLKMISRGIRKMAKSKDAEVNELLTKAADDLDELTKL